MLNGDDRRRFNQEVKVSDYSDGTAYYTLSDGYSVIQVYAESDGRVTYFFASDTFEGLNVDAEHTSITGPGGITVGSSTVEDLAEYDKNTIRIRKTDIILRYKTSRLLVTILPEKRKVRQ